MSIADFGLNVGANSVNDVIQNILKSYVGHDITFNDHIFMIAFSHTIQMFPTDYNHVLKLSKSDLDKYSHKITTAAFMLAHRYQDMINNAKNYTELKVKNAHDHNQKLVLSKTGRKRVKRKVKSKG